MGIMPVLEKKSKMGRTAKKWIAAILYTAVFIFLLLNLYAESVNRDLSESIIRLHIVANSDSDADQGLKYRVRDAVIRFMNEQMKNSGNKEDAGAYIHSHMDELEEVANNAIDSAGMKQAAKVSFGKFPFPTKRYQNIILPAGFYDAVKIEIGEAEGKNWWCVMFPPLCFVDDTKGELKEEYIGILEEKLSEEEMDIILTTQSDQEIPVEIRFKIVEIFQESKMKLASLFRGIIEFN